MKKLYFMFIAMIASLAANAMTVYYDNSKTKWESVYCYAWQGTVTNFSWPGTLMKKGEGDIWSLTADGIPNLIIFGNGKNSDNGGKQTADLKYVDNSIYDFYGVKGAPVETHVVYFDNSTAGWETVKIHYWGGNETQWDGVNMDKGEGDIWSYTIMGTAPKNCLFHNGAGTKTPDQTFIEGRTYNQNGLVPLEGEVITVTNVAFNGSINNGQWSGDMAMTEADGIWSIDVNVTGDSPEFGIRVTKSNGTQTWYMAQPGTNRITPAGTTTITLVAEGTVQDSFNTYIEAGSYTISFNPENGQLTATPTVVNNYAHWYIGLAYGGNEWNAENLETHPNAEGIAVFPEFAEIGGGYFRIRMWDNNEGKAYCLYGPEITELDTWYPVDRMPETLVGSYRIMPETLRKYVTVTVDVPNNQVKISFAEQTALNISYDNANTNWDNVKAHIWNNTNGHAIDIDLTQAAGTNRWDATQVIGLHADGILFYTGEWAAKTPDFEFENNKIYTHTVSEPALANGGTVWFDNSKSLWEAVYVYWWKGTTNNGWPGEPATHFAHASAPQRVIAAAPELDTNYDDAHGLWYFEFAEGGVDGIIFTNGKEGDELRKTANIEGDDIVDRGVYSAEGYTQQTAGIDTIEAAGACVEYYNLQGVRVAEPAAGLYIVRRGGKVSKEIVR